MKKNITINLFGQLYAIDEDAYQMLERYLGSMKQYFARQEGGEEIADDIEHRVAELLWERREAGQAAVDLDTIKAIIKQIGNPSEIDGADPEADPSTSDTAHSEEGSPLGKAFQDGMHAAGEATRSFASKARAHMRSRRYYRDPQDQILGGVCSGLACYFGGQDPLLWRLGMVLLAFASMGFACLLYLIIWICAPVAHGPEERLRMQGKEVNSANLSEQIISDSEAGSAPAPVRHGTGLSLLSGLVRAGLWGIGALLLGIVVLPCVVCVPVLLVAAVVLVGVALGLGPSIIHLPGNSLWVFSFYQDHWMLTLGSIMCGLLVAILPIYGLVRMLRSDPSGNLSAAARLGLVMLWIAALVLGICLVTIIAVNYEQMCY